MEEIDNKNRKSILKTKNIEEGGLNEVPQFYYSLADNSTRGRLKDIDVRKGYPYVNEILEGTIASGTIQIYFNKKIYKFPPYVTGIVESNSGEVRKLPVVSDIYLGKVTTGKVELVNLNSNYRRYKLRVYNLKYNE